VMKICAMPIPKHTVWVLSPSPTCIYEHDYFYDRLLICFNPDYECVVLCVNGPFDVSYHHGLVDDDLVQGCDQRKKRL
jgi:hypothetical protein